MNTITRLYLSFRTIIRARLTESFRREYRNTLRVDRAPASDDRSSIERFRRENGAR